MNIDQNTQQITQEIESLLSEKKRIETIVANTHAPLLVLSPTLYVVSMNRSFSEQFMVSENDTISRHFLDISNGFFNTPTFRYIVDRTLWSGKFVDTIDVTSMDGTTRIMLVITKWIKFGSDVADYLLIELQDITRYMQSIKELKTREKTYRILSNKSFEGIAIMLNGKYVYVNEEFANQLGVTVDEALQLTNEKIWALVHPDDKPILQNRNDYLETDAEKLPKLRFRYLPKSGTTRWVDSFVRKIDYFGEPAKLIFQIDVTDSMILFREIEQKERRLRTIIETSPVGIAICDKSGSIIEMNQAGLNFLGISTITDLAGINIFQLPNFTRDKKQRIKRGETLIFETAIDFAKVSQLYNSTRNDIVYAKFAIAPLKFDSDGEEGYIVQVMDITDQKLAEKNATTAAETAFLLSDFLTHDLRNYLQKIMMATELLSFENSNKQHLPIRTILDSVDAASKLISKIAVTKDLIYAPFEKISILDSIEKALDKLASKYEKVKVTVDIKESDALVVADRHLKDLFYEILENAVIHNPKSTKHIWIGMDKVERGYLVRIADNGSGLTDSMKEDIQSSKRYKGVGLFRVKLVLKKYGGWLKIKDREQGCPPCGTEFRLLIPYTPAET